MVGFVDPATEGLAGSLMEALFAGDQPLVELIMTSLLMALALLLPSSAEAMARGIRAMPMRMALALRRKEEPPEIQAGANESNARGQSAREEDDPARSGFPFGDSHGLP